MATAVHTQNSRGGGLRGRRTNQRGRGRGGAARGGAPPIGAQQNVVSAEPAAAAEVKEDAAVDDGPAESEEDVCWICAEPVKYYSVGECNHRTCHVCALRLRALYKKLDCTFCKVHLSCMLSSPR
jgi:hypothetical protein